MESIGHILPPDVVALLNRIEAAFRGVARPKITKNVARGWDDDWVLSDERADELAVLDQETDWHEITDDDTEKFQEYFAFSDAEGWLFYLPAYISHDLRRYPHCGANAVYWACLQRDRLSHLKADQRGCVDTYLEIVHALTNQTDKGAAE